MFLKKKTTKKTENRVEITLIINVYYIMENTRINCLTVRRAIKERVFVYAKKMVISHFSLECIRQIVHV